MTLDKIKEFVKKNKGIQHSFKFKGTRNQVDEFQGIITDLYPAIFIITLDDDKVKSFSYNDLLADNLEIVDLLTLLFTFIYYKISL